MATSWKSQQGKGEYALQFETDDEGKYKLVEKAAQMAVDGKTADDLVEVVRCKDCKYHHWEQEPEHGKTIHLCSVLNAEVFKDFYCYHGTPKERGEEK